MTINQTAPGLTLTGLPDLPPDAIGATINGVHYTRTDYEALRAQGAPTSSPKPTDKPTRLFHLVDKTGA